MMKILEPVDFAKLPFDEEFCLVVVEEHVVLELALNVDAIFVIGNRVEVAFDLLVVRLRDRGKSTII